jgi:hypothetical protein
MRLRWATTSSSLRMLRPPVRSPEPNGASIDKDALHNAALAEVEDTFGDVLTTDEIIKLPVR